MKPTIELFCTFALSIAISVPSADAQSRKEAVDLIVGGGTVVTMDGSRRIIEDGAIAVKGDSIQAVGPQAEVESKYAAKQQINARGKLVLPGFINGHTHAPMVLLRSLKDDV